MIRAKVSTQGLQRRLAGLSSAAPEAGETAVQIMAQEFLGSVVDASPRDTNRYVRGWMEAGNKAGVSSYALPQIEPSRFADRFAARLERQLVEWEQKLEEAERIERYWRELHQERYVAKGRTDKWERDLLKKAKAAAARVEKTRGLVTIAREQVDKYHAGAVVIWGRSVKREFSKGQLATVREQAYGGDGKMMRNGWGTVVLLHNLEAHASIVEKRLRIVARATARLRAVGFKRATRAMTRALQASWKRAA
jgi:hypothetical protein